MASEGEKKKKRPTAQKRMIQNEKKRERNRVFKSQVRTAIRNFEKVLSQGDSAVIKEKLNDVYSTMDKGVKRGIYKLNNASRTKGRLTARAMAKS